MNHKLSIIMPCYNSSATMEESVASIYAQNLNIPFELVMVDDGSSDDTQEIIKKLAQNYDNIKYFFHKKNKGGGATRNTAVKNSEGDLIFCLDSDDILPDNMLTGMINYLDEKKCDGILFHESRYFTKDKANVTSSSINTLGDDAYSLPDLLDDKGWLTIVNFLYTKNAFKIIDGYPENHGFDTQGFGFNFLAKGLKAYTCPNTYYFHRQASNEDKSYFNRVYEEGLFSINFYLIFEEFIYLFSNSIIKNIINFNIFSQNKLGGENINEYLRKKYAEKKEAIFIKNYKQYAKANGFSDFVKSQREDTNEYLFISGIYAYKQKKYEKALSIFSKMSNKNLNTPIVKFNIERCKAVLNGTPETNIEKSILQSSDKFTVKTRETSFPKIKKIIIKIPGSVALYHFIKKLFKKNKIMSKIKKIIIKIPGSVALYHFIKKVLNFPSFINDFKVFKKLSKNSDRDLSLKYYNLFPCLLDKTEKTSFEPHYTYHPAWAARIIKKINPEFHVDISSSLNFVTMLSAFVPTKFYDFRPAYLNLDNLESKTADLNALDFKDNSINSLSCLHVVEHIGLGRYGDKLDANGDIKAIKELTRILAKNGSLLFVVPVGKAKITFNAHRIYSYEEIINHFPKLRLKEFSLIPDNFEKTGIIYNADPELVKKQEWGCGCFWFIKE